MNYHKVRFVSQKFLIYEFGFDHFNYYRLNELKLKQRCSELLVLEECCEEIYLLETMFYEEIKTWNTEE